VDLEHGLLPSRTDYVGETRATSVVTWKPKNTQRDWCLRWNRTTCGTTEAEDIVAWSRD